MRLWHRSTGIPTRAEGSGDCDTTTSSELSHINVLVRFDFFIFSLMPISQDADQISAPRVPKICVSSSHVLKRMCRTGVSVPFAKAGAKEPTSVPESSANRLTKPLSSAAASVLVASEMSIPRLGVCSLLYLYVTTGSEVYAWVSSSFPS